MKIKTLGVLSLVLLLTLNFSGIASAKPTSVEACTEDTVSGIVVSVNETTGEMTVLKEDGTLCTVVKNTEAYNHPVINILGEYFEKVSLEDFESLQTWVVPDGDTWVFADVNAPGAVQATVIGVTDNPDGTYDITLLVEGETETITTDDQSLYETYLASLEGNTTTFNLIIDEFGNAFVSDGADEIGAYHDDGIGLGVLVKLYAMADAYDVPVDDLVTRFKNGEGIGQLFKDEELGKPDLLGVGHVFNELGKNPGHPNGKDNPSASNKSDKPEKDKNKNK